MNFRYDINGLRTIAVLAVVLFHFNPQWLPGGFAGVDVFFVISGFLMTSIIFTGIEKNTFNLFKFYNARANRIIPVLAAVSSVLLVFGWFYLLPYDYKELGKQIEKSSLFISNIFFSKGGGYFDTAEHTKWLLHTWSLSVEWQFYIFFPIIIIVLKKYLSLANLKRFVFSLFLVSFIYCIYATNKDSKTAYFLLTSRAWEMLLGGLAFLYPWSIKNKVQQIAIQYLGLVLIIASYFLISKNTPWPGYIALIPVLGAYLIIISDFQTNIILNNPIMSNIGKWSYSIYVWHWPLVVFGFYFTIENWWIYGIPLSILLGFLSYQLIEKINFTRYSSWREIYKVKPFYIFLIILACGFTVKKTDGIEFRHSLEVRKILNERTNSNPYKCDSQLINNKLVECRIGYQNNVKAIIIGDSHADALTTSITNIFNLNTEGVISIPSSGCPYISNAKFNDNDCGIINLKRQEFIDKHPGIPLILISRYLQRLEGNNDPDEINWRNPLSIYFTTPDESKDQKYFYFEKNLKESICSSTKKSPVYIVLTVPELGFNAPKISALKLMQIGSHTNATLSYGAYLKRSKHLNDILIRVANECGAKTIDPSLILCKSGKCIYELNGRPIYRDDNHLSEFGNKLLTPMFKESLTP